jgi:hypothetical protein
VPRFERGATDDRCLLSAQAWLRMREEFGVPGVESGPTVAWVIDTLFAEIRHGRGPSTYDPEAARGAAAAARPAPRSRRRRDR